jgi:hypothetical protein
MLRRSLLAAALALAAAPACASGAEKDEKVVVGQYVDLSPVALPIVVDGRLVNYVFAYVRINLTAGANSVKLREKEPFFRDALVRAGHRTPFTNPKDYTVLDSAKLTAALMREAAAIAGPGAVKSVVITSQTPKRRQGLPAPRAAA